MKHQLKIVSKHIKTAKLGEEMEGMRLTPECIKSLNIVCFLYGSDNGGQTYFVQTCCDQEHTGNECGCCSLGEDFTKEEAEARAQKLSSMFNLPAFPSC